MANYQYGSAEFYKVLVAIDVKIASLPCHGKHIDGGKAKADLLDYLYAEMTACAVRAARTRANQQARLRAAAREQDSGD